MGPLSKALAGGRGTSFRPRIALIIDDIGFSLCRARQFLDLAVPVTYAVLPRLSHSHALAREIHAEGHEVMLHQPMEPFNASLDPGPGALYVGDEAGIIVKTIEENISEVPFATGVNNHMGSKFTACPKEIQAALQVVKNSGLFFVDSLTSSRSMAYKTARELHLDTACRNIFLDNRADIPSILSQLHRLRRHAARYGQAIGIGHPFPETAGAIRHFLKGLSDSEISFVHVSDLVLSA